MTFVRGVLDLKTLPFGFLQFLIVGHFEDECCDVFPEAFYRRSVLCRSKTAWPSRSRMRRATVLGGKARFAAATIAADTSDA